MRFDKVLINGIGVFPQTGPAPVNIGIASGTTTAILSPTEIVEAGEVIDARGRYIFPGLIDGHVHFGFAEPITEYSTETIYAAQGGITSVAGYLLNNESYGDVLEREMGYAASRALVDYAFHLAVATELHLHELSSYVHDYGITSFKYFMNFRGEEGRYIGLDGTDDGYLFALLEKAAEIGDLIIVLHTENIEIVNRIRREFQGKGKDTLRDWCLSKPAFTEAENVVRAAYFAEHHGATIYIPHLSSRMALDEVRRWRQRYPAILVETCPHYLTHTLDSNDGSIGKANPPFRTADDVDALWEGLADGTIDVVASDHVPRKRATKERGIWQASQGFPGTATLLPILLSEGFHKGRLTLQRISQLLSNSPAKIFGLASKGDICVGKDADFTIVDPDYIRTVHAADLGSWSDYSLYDGWKLRGWPVTTIVRGEVVMDQGNVRGQPGHGRYLRRGHPILATPRSSARDYP